jgi:hypothetical protein
VRLRRRFRRLDKPSSRVSLIRMQTYREFPVTAPHLGSDTIPQGRPQQVPASLKNCMMLEYDPRARMWRDVLVQKRRDHASVRADRAYADRARVESDGSAINPIALGLCLALCPPLGVTLVWTSSSMPREGKLAITFFGGFALLLMTTFALAFLFA